MINPHIKCGVKACKHNDQAQHCSLDSIVIGNNNCNSAHSKCDTECNSFEGTR